MSSGPTLSRVVVVHGYAASPRDHWFDWLADELQGSGASVRVPAMPGSASPRASEWDAALRDELETLDGATALVGHSLGSAAVLRHLSTRGDDWRLGTLVLVAGFVSPVPGLAELDQFSVDHDRAAALPRRIDRIAVLRSDDDTVVPSARTDELAALLGVTAGVVPDAGHFTSDDGVRQAPAVRQALLGR